MKRRLAILWTRYTQLPGKGTAFGGKSRSMQWCPVVLFVVGLLVFLGFFAWESGVCATQVPWPSPDEIKASAWIVYDRSTGTAVLENNADQLLYPASTTKIMTALLVLENLPLDSLATASETAVKLGPASSKIGLIAGETAMVRDLVTGMMVGSGNDAANVLAEALDGSNEQFAWRMNDKAASLGLVETHFRNPSGLHDDAHVTTARELARLADYAMDNEQFREIVSLKTWFMPATNVHPFPGWALLINSNRLMLFGDTIFHTDTIVRYTGIKTGSTYYAGNCLVASAELTDGRELICVLLGVQSDDGSLNPYNITRTLIDEAARIVLKDDQPGDGTETSQTETAAITTTTHTEPTDSTAKPGGSQTIAPTGSTEPAREAGSQEPKGLSGFITANPWRMAFILLGLFGAALYIRSATREKKRRKNRRSKAMPVRPRRIDRP